MEKRSQYLFYELLEKYQLSPIERSVLQIVCAKPHYYKSTDVDNCSTLAKIGQLINRSKRTIQRAIKSLQQKGIISVSYTFFKNIIIKIESLKKQKEICKEGLVSQVIKYVKNQRNKKNKTTESYPHVTPMSHSRDVTPMSHSTKNEYAKKSIIPNKLNFDGFLGNILKQESSNKTIEQRKAEQLMKYAQYLKQT